MAVVVVVAKLAGFPSPPMKRERKKVLTLSEVTCDSAVAAVAKIQDFHDLVE